MTGLGGRSHDAFDAQPTSSAAVPRVVRNTRSDDRRLRESHLLSRMLTLL